MELLPSQDKSKIMKKFVIILTLAMSTIMMGCSKYPDLGGGYRFINEGKDALEIVNYENTVVIGQSILDYAFDSTFIIVSQRPWDRLPNIRTMTYKESNEAFEKSTFLQYWILDKKEKNINIGYDSIRKRAIYSNVYGPYQRYEYLQKRKELGVPKDLKLSLEK